MKLPMRANSTIKMKRIFSVGKKRDLDYDKKEFKNSILTYDYDENSTKKNLDAFKS